VGEAATPPNERNRPERSTKVGMVRFASECSLAEMAPLLNATESDVLKALLDNPLFGEREALLLLNRRDLPSSVIQELASKRAVASNYALKLALTKHPKTPMRIALEQLKFLYVFDLVSVCLQTGVRAEVKRASEELILAQVPKLAIGQRITLAKRGPARLAASLLKGENSQMIQAVLDNPYLTEAVLLPVLNRSDCPPKIVESIARHPKWGLRYDVRLGLLRHSSLPLARALAILPGLKPQDAKAISEDPAVIPQVRSYLSNRLKGSKRDT
jgi:predicted regulator of amino acid metabolism with ACT domain